MGGERRMRKGINEQAGEKKGEGREVKGTELYERENGNKKKGEKERGGQY
jgi:hypothetical protein